MESVWGRPDLGHLSRNLWLIGHARVAITEDIYAHITSSVMEEAAEKIEKQLIGK